MLFVVFGRRRISHPRKLKPFLMCLMVVFSSLISKPRGFKNSLMSGIMVVIQSLLGDNTTKSSAYRTSCNLRDLLGLLNFRMLAGVLCRSTTFCSPFRAILQSIGEITPPCGVPQTFAVIIVFPLLGPSVIFS